MVTRSIAGVGIFLALCSSIAFSLDKAEPLPATQPVVQGEMVGRTFVLLTLTDNPPDLDEAAAADLQRRHLAHIASMASSGKVLVAGPFSNRDDERFRGALIFSCPIDEARAMANEDPAVKAGRLKVVCMTWNTSRGAMVFPSE